jgi:hypothetical protein
MDFFHRLTTKFKRLKLQRFKKWLCLRHQMKTGRGGGGREGRGVIKLICWDLLIVLADGWGLAESIRPNRLSLLPLCRILHISIMSFRMWPWYFDTGCICLRNIVTDCPSPPCNMQKTLIVIPFFCFPLQISVTFNWSIIPPTNWNYLTNKNWKLFNKKWEKIFYETLNQKLCGNDLLMVNMHSWIGLPTALKFSCAFWVLHSHPCLAVFLHFVVYGA